MGLGNAPVIGIEVTLPEVAKYCMMNLDHHGEGDTAETPSACEKALEMKGLRFFGNEVLITVRPDADSVTAMAIIENRFDQKPIDENLVKAIGRFDRFGPSAGRPDDVVTAIAVRASDFKISLEERVRWVGEILAGDKKEQEIAAIITTHDLELAEAIDSIEISVHHTLKCNACGFDDSYQESLGGLGVQCGRCTSVDTRNLPDVAVIISTHRFATMIGYQKAPIVVAMNPKFPVDFKNPSRETCGKITVCRYDSHVKCNLPAALKELRSLEDGWGGRGDIFGSPQGVTPQISLSEVVGVVLKNLF
jgi:hypothetical protein